MYQPQQKEKKGNKLPGYCVRVQFVIILISLIGENGYTSIMLVFVFVFESDAAFEAAVIPPNDVSSTSLEIY